MQVPHLAGGYKPTLRALTTLYGALSAGLSGTEALGYVLIHAPGSAGFRLEPTTTPAQVASRRVDLRLIKRPRPDDGVPGQYLWTLIRRELGKWCLEPPRANSRRFYCRP